MAQSKQQTSFCQEDKQFLTCSYKSKEHFVREYKKFYSEKAKAEQLYLLVLTELEVVISEGNVGDLKKLDNFINYLSNAEDQVILRDYYDNVKNPLRSTNLVILACKHNKVTILEYLLHSDSKILNNLSVGIKGTAILPEDVDETWHNGFYYSICSGNIKLIDTLINKWPGNYFAVHLEELDNILSRAYEELKLKNVPLSEGIEIFVENKLIDLRFFSDANGQDQNVKDYLKNVRERIDLVLHNVTLLKVEYSNTEIVDERFLFVAKFIAQNIHILKRQLKSTYARIPWEEMEFCLISFVSSHIKKQEINLFYQVTLSKGRILNHLENFSNKLEEEKYIMEGVNIHKLADLPTFKREEVVAEIVSNYSHFEELYSDYQQIRDIHSLEKISDCIELVLSANPKERKGQLIITRALQVIGEYFKNTLESPKLSSTTSELLLLSLPKNTRQIIIDLRNSLSHAYSLSKRTEIEENTDVNFFICVQNDTKKIGDVITYILYNKKIKTIRTLLKKFVNSKNLDETKDVAEIFSYIDVDAVIKASIKGMESIEVMEYDKLEKLIKELSSNITDKTNYEKELFNKINNIINFVKTKSKNIRTDYMTAFISLKSLGSSLNDNKIDHNLVRIMKFFANKVLENIAPKIESHDLKEIVELSTKISRSARLRIRGDNLDKVDKITCEIFYLAEFETGELKWIEGLRDKLNVKGSFIPIYKHNMAYNITEEKYNDQLAGKISELKDILKNNGLSGKSIEKLSSFKKNKKLQAVVEMLVLDIMSILGSSNNCLENNLCFLDNYTPLLIGKCLRNHLAHDNFLLDAMLSDNSVAVVLNAKKLTSENIMKNKRKVGKLVTDRFFKLKDKYEQSLIAITNQEKMFTSLKKGNLEELKSYLKKGADINARSINSSTALHFAAHGNNLKLITFILNQKLDINVKDSNGHTPLHIAAAHGSTSIMEFLIREAGLNVDDLDNNHKTPLHIAAKNGHKDIVEILLKNNSNTNTKDAAGFSPLHYAIKNDHIDVAKVMLEKEADVDINETMGGYTSLHIAAESGYLGLVNFLLKNGANVNARNDKEGIPLHTTALNGHLEVVNALILNGADVNARVIDGCTSLHYAVENGHEKIANTLLKHGANVNTADKTYNNTPLHYAAKDGHENIVKALLKNKANAKIATVQGITPLHFAVQGNHLKIVAALLDHEVNISAKDINNATPLHYAAEYGCTEVAELLIKHGAEINAKDDSNLTPLHVAAAEGHKDIIELLIRNKAEVLDLHGSTLLHTAAMNGSKDVLDILIRNKAEVDARNNVGLTPLHVAAIRGHEDAISFLIKNKAEVNTTSNDGLTPLYLAIVGGYEDIVNLLIRNGAKIDTKGVAGNTPLYVAVEAGHKNIVEILIANGANVNSDNHIPPLVSAVKHNHKDIVKILLENGANVDADGGEPLLVAVFAGYRDIVEILLKNKARIDMKGPEDATLLQLAAKRGHKEIVNTLIIRGANVDAKAINSYTPLHVAAQEGYKEVAEVLIANKANVNVAIFEGTPLHIAAANGHVHFVEVLLSNGAKVNIKDKKNRTPLELAVARNHLQVVKMLLQYMKVDMNAKGNDDFTILHIASQEGNLEIVKCLVDGGCDINAKNVSGSKPIHIAVREGYKDTVAFFLSKGMSVNEHGMTNQTLLHYAVMSATKGQLEVIKYLIEQGADVNAKDTKGVTPMHVAAYSGYKHVVEVLLKSDAVYNPVDKLLRKPLDVTDNKNVINLLATTEKLFESVKLNSTSEVEKCIRAGAFINPKNVDGATSLHYAAWKGHDGIVKILLQNKANPNAIGSKGFTPIHYAAKFSHLKIIKALLFHGAMYNAISDTGKTPSDLTVDRDITVLFKLISESFKKVTEDKAQVVNDLNKIKDIDTVKAVMSACNTENETLVVAAIRSNFSKVEQLKEISQCGISAQIAEALILLQQGNYQRAINIFTPAFERRKEILGPNNPGTLDFQTHIAQVLYKQGNYQDALNMLEDILEKQKEILGLNDESTLSTRSTIALVLHRQGKDEKAFNIYQEVCQKQKEILGPNHSDTINSMFHMALVLDRQGKYEEALNINKEVFENRKKILGPYSIATVSAQNNIAMVLANQYKHEESLKIYKEVFEKKKMLLGIHHSDTLRTLHSIAGILLQQKKYHEALKAFQEVLNIQKKALQQNHPETLITQYNIGNIFFNQGKHISAFKAYTECLDRIKTIFGPSHPTVLDILQKIKIINFRFKLEGSKASEVLQHLQKDINIAASKGDVQTVQRLLKDGADANDTDIDGITPLHYAVSYGHVNIVNILLKNGANVTQVTNKGNTPLHTASSKYYKDIVDVLLQHVSRDKLNDFVNAKTSSSGTTSLHIAAKGSSLQVVQSLLKHGATYNIENKEGKTPINLSQDHKVTELLKLIEELFEETKKGNIKIINKLLVLKKDELLAVTNARNNQGKTLLQVAATNGHKNVTSKLLEIIKKPDHNLKSSV